ncbi:MAG: toprim domain-containing protein [Candidatus Hydrothermarchaeaceae archaeon]
MHIRDYEGLLEHIEELKEAASNTPIIVEGKRDEEALRNLGVEAEFHWASSAPFHEFCDEMTKRYKEIIIFTDMDRAGKRLAKRLGTALRQRGIKVHEKYRPILLGKLETHHVEGLAKRLERTKAGLFWNGFWR